MRWRQLVRSASVRLFHSVRAGWVRRSVSSSCSWVHPAAALASTQREWCRLTRRSISPGDIRPATSARPPALVRWDDHVSHSSEPTGQPAHDATDLFPIIAAQAQEFSTRVAGRAVIRIGGVGDFVDHRLGQLNLTDDGKELVSVYVQIELIWVGRHEAAKDSWSASRLMSIIASIERAPCS